ncbi:MAG: EamA family transporter [Candidatus Limnocylindrales bacterium]
MNPLGVLLGLASAGTWGTADFLGGFVARRIGALPTAAASQAIGLLGALTIALLAGERVPGALPLFWGAVAGLCGVSGVVAFYRALADGTMGIVSPVVAVIGAAVPTVVGILLGDRIAPPALAGIACALVAIVVVSGFTPGQRSGSVERAALPLIVAAGLGFAGFFLGIDQAVRAGGEVWWPLVAARAASAVVSLVVVARIGGLRPSPWGEWRLLVAVGLGDLLGNAFFVLANDQGTLGAAAVLSSLYPVTTVLLARVVLGERLRVGQAIGVGLALLGVVLIALPGG